MPLRFRRSLSLFPGARLNFSKSGVSVSLGRPGATFNFGPRGSSATFGLPGTGLSYRVPLNRPTQRGRSRASERGAPEQPYYTLPPSPQESPPEPGQPGYVREEGEISSGPVGTLTSASLADLKRLILEARQRLIDLRADLTIAIRARDAAYRWHWFRSHFPLRLLGRAAIAGAEANLDEQQAALEATAIALSSCYMRLSFQMPPQLAEAWR